MLIDLFCGCGGFSLGAHRAGFETAVAIDLDETLSSSFGLNFPSVPVRRIDLSKLTDSGSRALFADTRPTGIIGGPPCQGFSIIGRRNLQDKRNSLVDHFFRHVANLRPKFFAMENVPGILSEAGIGHLERGLSRLPGSYDVLPPLVLDASEFGAPTIRKRAFIVGYDKTVVNRTTVDEILDGAISDKITVRQAIGDLPPPQTARRNQLDFDWVAMPHTNDIGALASYAALMRQTPVGKLGWETAVENLKSGRVSGFLGTNHSLRVRRRFATTSPGSTERISRYPRLDWTGQCATLRAGTGADRGSYQAVRPIHPEQPRVISIREAARLQGFPDWFVFHPTIWHSFRMIGNSVSPPVAETLLRLLRRKCERVDDVTVSEAA